MYSPYIRPSKIVRDTYVLDGVSFKLYPGDHYASIIDYGVRMCEDLYLRRSCSIYGMYTLCFPKILHTRRDLLESNWCISSCLEGWLRDIHWVRPSYVWVRERDRSEIQHYHVGVWVDESVSRSIFCIGESLQYHWSRVLGDVYSVGCVEYTDAEKHKIWLNRNDGSSLHACVYAYSYLSKTYSKEEIAGVRRWGHGL